MRRRGRRGRQRGRAARLRRDQAQGAHQAGLFVALQVVLLVALVVLPSRSDWPVPGWLQTVGLAGVVLGLVGIGAIGKTVASVALLQALPTVLAPIVRIRKESLA